MRSYLYLIALMLCGCAAAPTESLPELGDDPTAPVFSAYRIQPGDQLDIRFFDTPELDELITVRPDGRIGLRLLDEAVEASGRTPEELEADLRAAYAGELRAPEIDVVVRAFAGQKVYVGGEVRKPGIVAIDGDTTVLQAIILAGGMTELADEKEVLVIRKGREGQPTPHRARLAAGRRNVGHGGPRLAATDVVYVPRSRIADANRFVEQYIRGLLMFDGFRISFGYDLDDELNR